jgi:hypothetical protein
VWVDLMRALQVASPDEVDGADAGWNRHIRSEGGGRAMESVVGRPKMSKGAVIRRLGGTN